MRETFKNDCRFVGRAMADKYSLPVSDPARVWALSIKQPLASLIVEGVEAIVAKSTPPPVELIGCDLVIHAGAGDLPYKDFDLVQTNRVEAHFNVPLKMLRDGDAGTGAGRLPHGALIGTAKLVAGFKIGRDIGGRIYASPHATARDAAMGIWPEFDGTPSPPGKNEAGKWAWCFGAPHCFAAGPEVMTGTGYVFDLARWRGVQAEKAAREASLETAAEEALSRGVGA